MDVRIFVGGKEVSGVLIEGRTYARVADVLDACGFDYVWNVDDTGGRNITGQVITTKRPTLKVSEWFHLAEFACPCCGRVKITSQFQELVIRLHELRRALNMPIRITSAYRCKEHNEEVGGAIQSQHLLGAAADIVVEGMKPDRVAAEAAHVGFKGIGIYPTFTHVDVREEPANWRG